MKFTLKWLNDYVSLDGIAPQQLADELTMLGLEVDAVVDMAQGLEQIVTARIVKVEKHPDADRLSLCDVEVKDETIRVVCGAPNARVGLMTAIARPGVVLPDGMKIKKAKVRGQESLGMLCSAKELGISDEHSGILEIADLEETGVALSQALMRDDVMVEIDLTPNRPDCASVLGVAREVAGFTGRALHKPINRDMLPELSNSHSDFSVEIKEPELCLRYAARKLTGVTIGPSPLWLQQRLLAVGMRPINNIVDITNFVMLELGQPLHAFDFALLSGAKIIVRCPAADEKTFTTLDGSERTLEPDMLMICDNEHPVAVAGIMGGLDSEVTDSTTEILLESACFDPVSIRRTARKLNIPSEASYRFERGVDPDGVDIAMERAVQLMIEYAGATLVEGGIDAYPGRRPELVLPLRVQRVRDLLGIDFSVDEITGYLQQIEFGVDVLVGKKLTEEDNSDDIILQVTVPSFRVDIEREVDFIEEIARLVGYNDIPTTLPQISMDYPARDSLRTLRREIANILTSRSFYEAINYSFASEKHFDLLGLDPDDFRRKVTRILNPLTEDQAIMRSMLLPGLLDNVRHNLNYQNSDISLFEIGKVFFQHQEGGQPEERFQLCIVMSGERYPDSIPLYFSGLESDLFDIKGIAELLFDTLSIQATQGEIAFKTEKSDVQPYSQAESTLLIQDGDEVIGMVGKLTPAALKGFGIKQDVFFLEMDLTRVDVLPKVEKDFRSLPRYPSVQRDIALVLPDTVAAGDLLRTVRELNVENVENAQLFDVYRGKPIEKGMKSVAVSVTYRSSKKTLDDETVDIFHEKIVNTLMSRFGGRYRE